MDFVQLDVFCDGPYRGNPLAVLPDANDLALPVDSLDQAPMSIPGQRLTDMPHI